MDTNRSLPLRLTLAGLLLSGTTFGQSFILQPVPGENSRVSLSLHHLLTDACEISLFSGTYELFFDIATSRNNVNFQAIIPYTIMKYEHFDTKTQLGNIYVGMANRLSQSAENSSYLLYGLYVPSLDDDLFFYGPDYQKQPLYFNSTLSLTMTYRWRHITPGGLIYGLALGPDFILPNNGDPEMILHYGCSAGLILRNVALGAEFYGIMWLDEDFRDLGDYYWNHSLTLGAELQSGSFRPSLFIQLPLEDETRDRFDGVLGIRCEYIMH